MAVQVRLFAAVRDAAGTAETTAQPGALPAVLDELRARYGELFAARLAVCTVLVDGTAVPAEDPVAVHDGADVSLLPPFSGGSSARRLVGAGAMGTAPAGVVLALATAAAAAAGPLPFAVVVVLLAVALLVDLVAVQSAVGPRPVVLAAAIPGVALPVAVAARPETGWATVPDLVAGGVLAAFVVVLGFGRRREVTEALGSTMLAGLVVGLGASGLILLRSLPDGTRWVLGVVLVVAAVETARQAAATRVTAAAAAAATVGVALVAGAALVAGVRPPFGFTSAAGVAAVALLAGAGAGLLRDALDDAVAAAAADRAAPPPVPAGVLTAGVLTAAALPLLLAAPAAFALARLAAV